MIHTGMKKTLLAFISVSATAMILSADCQAGSDIGGREAADPMLPLLSRSSLRQAINRSG